MFATCDWLPLAYAVWVRWRRLEFSSDDYIIPQGGSSHQPSGGPVLAKVICSLHIPENSVALDLGVGMGLAALTLSPFFKLVIGVDISPELIAAARRNIAKMRVKNIVLHCADARVFKDGLDQVTHVYMFNPFPEAVMSEVMRQPERLAYAYSTPFDDHLYVPFLSQDRSRGGVRAQA